MMQKMNFWILNYHKALQKALWSASILNFNFQNKWSSYITNVCPLCRFIPLFSLTPGPKWSLSIEEGKGGRFLANHQKLGQAFEIYAQKKDPFPQENVQFSVFFLFFTQTVWQLYGTYSGKNYRDEIGDNDKYYCDIM